MNRHTINMSGSFLTVGGNQLAPAPPTPIIQVATLEEAYIRLQDDLVNQYEIPLLERELHSFRLTDPTMMHHGIGPKAMSDMINNHDVKLKVIHMRFHITDVSDLTNNDFTRLLSLRTTRIFKSLTTSFVFTQPQYQSRFAKLPLLMAKLMSRTPSSARDRDEEAERLDALAQEKMDPLPAPPAYAE